MKIFFLVNPYFQPSRVIAPCMGVGRKLLKGFQVGDFLECPALGDQWGVQEIGSRNDYFIVKFRNGF
ncbi:MAG: hypothetical protein A2V65_10790 [Deltaproteobacteria bacterium RBG_13_49_15]|nr:MAG: hypothetical protein A2V65_10790 [Deltaproteobacteria bacterium RBG_13_49_15]